MSETLRIAGFGLDGETGLESLLGDPDPKDPVGSMPRWTEWRMWMMVHGGKPDPAEGLQEYNRLARRTQEMFSKLSTANKEEWMELYYSDRDFFPPFPHTKSGSAAPNGLSKYKRSDGTPIPKLNKGDK